MRAIVFNEHGGPEVLRPEERPEPRARANEVLVEVRACALNHLDVWARSGLRGIEIPLPHILGNDIAGVVREAGELVDWVKPGDEVLLQPGVSCGHCRECLRGADNLCPSYDILGYRRDGGYAELVAAPAVNVVPKPKDLSWTEAAALPLVLVTAWHMLVTRARVQPGEDVLIHAAGSGVGSIGIQIARLFGARVIATAGSADKLARARELGAAEVINHYEQDIFEEIRRLTNRRGVDVVIEHVGEATWPKSVRSLARGGRLVTCGATTGYNGSLDLRALFAKQLTIQGSYMGTKGELLQAARVFFAGRLKPAIDRVFPLAEAAAAHRRLEESAQFGKIVLEVP